MRKPKGVKIMPDFSSSGIWDLKDGIMIEHEDLKLSRKLSKEFDEWIYYYDVSHKKDFLGLKKGKAEKLNTWGRALAKKIKKLHPKLRVEYMGEDEKTVFDSETVYLRTRVHEVIK
jgi:hypothetical protein